ncbi:MAG: hypothetical protein F6K65_06390 [Moorea sp. SIO3C2]|nr:hypothetical protein [Moorena sp. SIO3C2]
MPIASMLPAPCFLLPAPCSLKPRYLYLKSRRIAIYACVQLLAGVKFDEQLIQAYFREDMMQESVVYQRIIRQGLEQGLEQGKRSDAARSWGFPRGLQGAEASSAHSPSP